MTAFVNLQDLDPKCDPKYSKQLFRFLKKRYGSRLPKVYTGAIGGFTGYFVGEIDSDAPGPWQTAFTGARILSVLLGQHRTYAYPPLSGSGLTLVPDFWDRYRAIGVCAIDEAHWHYDERWDTQGDERVCRWCGKRQRLERYTYTEERTRWLEAEA